MKMFYAFTALWISAALMISPPIQAQEAAAEAVQVEAKMPMEHATGVLEFVGIEGDLADMSADFTALFNTALVSTGDLTVVDRGEIEKALGEIELGGSGLVDNESAAKIGHLIGAKILISGRLMAIQKDVLIAAKILGVENGRMFGVTAKMPLRGSLEEAAQSLAAQVSETILKNEEALIVDLPKTEDYWDYLNMLVDGKELPSVSVSIKEESINREVIDPAAETEMQYILQKLGFEIIDPLASNEIADVEVTGEAFSEFAMRTGNLVSSKARIEIKAIDRSNDSVLLVDRENSTAVDLAAETSGKKALSEGSKALTKRLVESIVLSIS